MLAIPLTLRKKFEEHLKSKAIPDKFSGWLAARIEITRRTWSMIQPPQETPESVPYQRLPRELSDHLQQR